MTDINEWNLSYPTLAGPNVDLDFGLASSDYPFTVQCELGEPDRITNDTQHGTDDAIFMGRDQLGGMDLTFTFTTLPAESDQINAALDTVSNIQAAWRAYQVSKTPGWYATLTNNYRERQVLGRPRNFTRKNARVRRGIIEYVGLFHTVSPNFYGIPSHTLSPARTVSTAAAVGGDSPSWPIITFTGAFTTANLHWTPTGIFPGFDLGIKSPGLASGDIITIDLRPWWRYSIGTDGETRNGMLSGDKLSDCFLFPSSNGHFLFTTTGTTDASTKCDIEWFDTYAGL